MRTYFDVTKVDCSKVQLKTSLQKLNPTAFPKLMPSPSTAKPTAIVIGAGPAGLMAAERLALAGMAVDVFDAMPSVGRKFLLAGKSGMNLTHAEDFEQFSQRYGSRRPQLEKALELFPPNAIRDWVHQLGIDTFVGSSGRVFPTDMKAAPLLRAWLHKLRETGVRFHMRHRWLGFDASRRYLFSSPQGELSQTADIVILALGGGSWARLGSDGRWFSYFADKDLQLHPYKPSNCGFECAWTPHFREKFAGVPLSKVRIHLQTISGAQYDRIGQFVISEHGVEGSLIYAFSAQIRDLIERDGKAQIEIDLVPDRSKDRVEAEILSGRGSRSWSSFLRTKLGLHPVRVGLLYERLSKDQMQDPTTLTNAIKALPLVLERTRPLDEAISSAGGVCFSELDENLMLKKLPSVFCAGEMLDWEAPTGGYLLTACFATGALAAEGALRYLQDLAERNK